MYYRPLGLPRLLHPQYPSISVMPRSFECHELSPLLLSPKCLNMRCLTMVHQDMHHKVLNTATTPTHISTCVPSASQPTNALCSTAHCSTSERAPHFISQCSCVTSCAPFRILCTLSHLLCWQEKAPGCYWVSAQKWTGWELVGEDLGERQEGKVRMGLSSENLGGVCSLLLIRSFAKM